MAELTLKRRRDESSGPRPWNSEAPGWKAFWELLGISLILFSLFVAASLAAGNAPGWSTGEVGGLISTALRFLVGDIIAFAVPAVIAWAGVLLFLGKRLPWSPTRAVGVLLLFPAVTGLIALPLADEPEMRDVALSRAGVLGVYMVDWHGLRLVGQFGNIGAVMALVTGGLAGLVMATHQPLTAMVRYLWRTLPRRPAVEGGDSPVAAPPLEAAPAARKTRRASLVDDDEAREEAGDDDKEAGLFGGLLRRRKPAVLSEPDPDELFDADGEQYDEDALAAARALEEARIDEEYERALREEQERRTAGKGEEDEAGATRQPDILFHDTVNQTLDFVSGNPADERELTGGEEEVLGEGLAKLFPNRWEKGEDGVVRKDPNAKETGQEEERLGKAEARALRRTLQAKVDEVSSRLDKEEREEPAFSAWNDGEEDNGGEIEYDGEGDPLFNDELDTRPAGPLAAMKAASVSAMDRGEETESQRRGRVLADYRLPDIKLLSDPPRVETRMTREEMLEISDILEKTFNDFSIQVKVTEVKQGPVVTRFELKPAPGVKVSKIVGLEHDIALAMKAVSVRIVAPIPGKAAVGIEVPNKQRSGVYFKELVSCVEFWEHPSPLGFALGKTIDGVPYYADLKKMPHLLIAGATGAGKSVCLNTIICSLLYRQRPDRIRLLLVDPKRVELSIYSGIPHLISPVICEPKSAAAALAWAVEQMEERYKTLVEFKVRNIDSYNEIAHDPERHPRFKGRTIEPMPHMVVVVDELADLMVVARNEVEESIQRLAQMARAVGIHLILATQRPSVNVITGIIKANFPTRIAFQVRQKVDSRTILDQGGAEALLGRGDMLFAPAGAGKPIRLQGSFLSDEEVERVADHCRQFGGPMYEVEEFEPLLSEKEQRELARLMGSPEDLDDLGAQDRAVRGTNRTMGKVNAGLFVPHEGGSANAGDEDIDEALVRAAARVILEGRKGSTSLVQRRLKVGFARAGRLMDMLEEMGLVGPYKGSKPREILVDPDLALDQLDALEEKMARSGQDIKAAAMALDDED